MVAPPPPGEPVAELVVRDVHGRELCWPLVAGSNTGPPRPAPAPTSSTARLAARVARYELHGRGYEVAIGASYHASFPLPSRWQVGEVRLERRHAATRLRVTGVWPGDAAACSR